MTWELRKRQGTGDNFYKQGQLLPENFLKAARDAGYDEVQVRVRSQDDYDHSYYFVSNRLLYSSTVYSTFSVRSPPSRLIMYIVSTFPLYVVPGLMSSQSMRTS